MRRHGSHPSFENKPLVSRRALRFAALIGAAAAAFSVVSLSFASFNYTTAGVSMAVTSKKIFPGVRSTSAWNLKDASAGAGEVDASDAFLASGDSQIMTPGFWSASFSSPRYVQFHVTSSRPRRLA